MFECLDTVEVLDSEIEDSLSIDDTAMFDAYYNQELTDYMFHSVLDLQQFSFMFLKDNLKNPLEDSDDHRKRHTHLMTITQTLFSFGFTDKTNFDYCIQIFKILFVDRLLYEKDYKFAVLRWGAIFTKEDERVIRILKAEIDIYHDEVLRSTVLDASVDIHFNGITLEAYLIESADLLDMYTDIVCFMEDRERYLKTIRNQICSAVYDMYEQCDTKVYLRGLYADEYIGIDSIEDNVAYTSNFFVI
ncbi:hypothetical protein CYMTET_2492 [Cymbomonas tetramitiformis]|uniref:Uncharacterized protein n=1 Tax=Cymbomonas tetramitiformis TaxID=36881 RepID=A0AAE0LMG3_9CHLO|nr:hypothetical protein CYMTET_2492 [Cymbomonas tetramitiformis]